MTSASCPSCCPTSTRRFAGCASADACAACSRCSGRRSSPPSRTCDPGNFATNVSAGARYGFLLLWVIVVANLMAMLVQYLSAKPASSPAAISRSSVASLPAPGHAGACGCRPSSSRWPPISPSSSVRPSRCNLLFGVPPLPPGFITARRRLRHPCPAVARLPSLRARIIGAAARSSLLGFAYDLVRSASTRRRCRRARPAPGWDGLPAAGRRHPRSHRHAARRLPALGADGEAHPGRERRRAPRSCCASSAPTCVDRARPRRPQSTSPCSSSRPAVPRPRARVDRHDRGATRARDARRRRGAALAFAVALLASGLSSLERRHLRGRRSSCSGFIHLRISLFVRRAVTMAPSLVVLGAAA